MTSTTCRFCDQDIRFDPTYPPSGGWIADRPGDGGDACPSGKTWTAQHAPVRADEAEETKP